jgi:hypothetical protein
MGEVCDEVVAWELSEVVKKCLQSRWWKEFLE